MTRQADLQRRSAAITRPPSARGAVEIGKLIDVSRCIGCKACQSACMEWNDLRAPVEYGAASYTHPADLGDQTWCLMRFYETEVDGRLQWLIRKDGCHHCADPGCLRACPSPGAIVQHRNGIVDFDEDFCIGCGECVAGCPFDIPRLRKEDSRAYKCTLCSDRVAAGLEPACVKSCPTHALSFGSKEDMLDLAQSRLPDLRERGFGKAAVYNPPRVGGAHVFYVLPHGDRPEAYGLPADPAVSPVVRLWRSTSARGLGVFTMFAVLAAGILHYMRYGPLDMPEGGDAPAPTPDKSGAKPGDAREAAHGGAEGMILRHSVGDRLNHWLIAIAYVFLFLSGLAMFHPFYFWVSQVFGSGQFMRLLHPFAGVLLALMFYPYAAKHWRDNKWLRADTSWMRNMLAVMQKRHHPEDTGKYNAGQKLMFWSMVPIIAVLLATGVMLWQPWFAPAFPPVARRVAGLLHVVAAFCMFVGIGVHWYAAYWTRGSVRAMIRGFVTRQWAKFHHPAWFKEMTGGE